MSRVIHSAEFEEERAWMKFVSKRSECYGKDKWNGKKWEKYFKHLVNFIFYSIKTSTWWSLQFLKSLSEKSFSEQAEAIFSTLIK